MKKAISKRGKHKQTSDVVVYMKATDKPTAAQLKQLEALSGNPDTSDIPEVTEFKKGEWVRGLFHMPPQKRRKVIEEMRRQHAARRSRKTETVRLDADVADWFKKYARKDDGYQASINAILRQYAKWHEDLRGM